MTEHTAIARRLRAYYEGLITLKEDRTTYIKAQDVLSNYETLCELLKAHEEQFGEYEASDMDGNGTESEDQLESERLLHDCFLLISLFYLTIGKNNEPPATFARCAVIKRLLVHLRESDNFAHKDLEPIHKTLKQCKETVSRHGSTADLRMIRVLDSKVNQCLETIKPLQTKLDEIPLPLRAVHTKLVSLRRSIKGVEGRKKGRFSESDVKALLEQIKSIDAARVDGRFVGDDGNVTDQGQAQVAQLLERSYATADDALKRQGAIAEGLTHFSDKLYGIKHKLEKLELTQAWSLRETDLYDFFVIITTIDNRRVDRKFLADDGTAPEEGQSILLYLVRRAYAHVYILITSSEAVSEALTPIFNQLQTVRRCLKEVAKFGISDARELYPYSMKLSSIDNMRIDGKFMVGNDCPEGQGRVASLLAECFEICQELRENKQAESD
ncbi:hypothetical protein FPQ18DRAFT_399782 [Pyronema domesticum]|uniref:Similar to UPF0662 protein C30C2.08 acc. no. Q9P6K3 n=1 Tax=Pyronema omphalodes (strain CBS 100304) TaxID=1076935 RepID=U4LIH5_PYROM|nr:hypothetical protein FPQ18DRAFT_399782 [Pyronema domesticum]CCX31889.1 Similar to UPF0662 protein C30C2.08; acc. no. Q9P6K3 [Pyronema omphalodes CBS 100304]